MKIILLLVIVFLAVIMPLMFARWTKEEDEDCNCTKDPWG